MPNMKPIEIATKTNVSPMMVSLLKRGKTKTTNIQLAIEVARLTGKKPISFISNRVRSAFLKAYPDLDKKQRACV